MVSIMDDQPLTVLPCSQSIKVLRATKTAKAKVNMLKNTEIRRGKALKEVIPFQARESILNRADEKMKKTLTYHKTIQYFLQGLLILGPVSITLYFIF